MNKRSVIGDEFNEISSRYSSVMDNMVPHYRILIESLFKHLPADLKPKRILDIGCGNGNSSVIAARVFPDAEFHLLDASDDMLELCKERMAGLNCTYFQDVFQDFVPGEGAYDLMFACFSLHHLDSQEKQAFFKLIFDGLSNNGVFACADLFIDKNTPEHVVHLKDWRTFCLSNGQNDDDWDWLMDHYNKYDKPNAFEDQEAWLKSIGFEVEMSWNEGQWGCFHATKRT